MMQRITLPGILGKMVPSKLLLPFIIFSLFSFNNSLLFADSHYFEKSTDQQNESLLNNQVYNSPVACPIVLFIEPVSPFCLDPNTSVIELMVTVQGNDGTGFGVWSGPGIIDPLVGIFDPNDPSVTMGPNIITHTFSENGCVIIESTIIHVNPLPEVDAGQGNQLSCSDTVLTLSGTISGSNISYTWTGPGLVGDINSLHPKVNLPGTYFLTAVNKLTNCSNKDSVIITIDANVPHANAGPDKSISCMDSLAFLQGGGSSGPGFEFLWQGPDIQATDINIQNPEVKIPGAYILKVKRIANNCYSLPDTVLVLDNTIKPEVGIQQPIDTVNCKIINYNLIALEHENATYQWFDLSATPSILGDGHDIFIENPGLYTYLVTDTLNGCTNRDTIEVDDKNDYPYLEVQSPDTLDCNLTEIDLDASQSTTGAHVLYSWSGPMGGLNGNSSAQICTAVLPGAYTFVLLDTMLNCKTDTTILVRKINNAPGAFAVDPIELDCRITESLLDGTPSFSTNGHTYQWLFEQIVLSEEPYTMATQAGIYQLVVTDTINNCKNSTEVEVVFNDNTISKANIETIPNICFGDKNARIVIHSVEGGASPYLYSIDGGLQYVNIGHFGNLSAGDYQITIKDTYGCLLDTLISVEDPPKLDFSLGDDITLKLAQRDTIIAMVNVDYESIAELVWSPADQLNCINSDTCFAVSIQPMNNLTIAAVIKDKNGCMVRDEINIIVDRNELIFVPNVFSPNNDGKNDLFMIFGGPEIGKVNQFYVYNRSGETVYSGLNFKPNDPEYGWDGTLKGKELNPAVFVYWAEIELIDGNRVIYKGDVTLFR